MNIPIHQINKLNTSLRTKWSFQLPTSYLTISPSHDPRPP
jgi:hypothetical protein